MKRDTSFHGLCHVGAILAVFLLVFIGCSSPIGTDGEWNPGDELAIQMLEELFGFTLADNEDGTYTILSSDGWDGRIPIPEGFEPDLLNFPSRCIIEDEDGNTYLDLFAFENGDFIALPVLSQEISIARTDDIIVITLPGDISYFIIDEGDGSYTIRMTNRQLMNNFITAFESSLGDEGFSFIENKWHLSLPYQDEELVIPLPEIPEDFIVGITGNGDAVEITGFPILLPLVEGENTITIKVSLGKEEPIYVNLAVDVAYFVPITGITLNPETLILILGLDDGEDIYNAEPVIEPANATNKLIEWTTSDDSVVTVDADGRLIAQNSGIAVITAVAKHPKNINYETNSIEVTVGDLRLSNIKAKYTRKDGEVISGMPFEFGSGLLVESGVTTVEISFEKDERTESSFEVDNGLHLTSVSNGTWFIVGNLVEGNNCIYIKLTFLGHLKTYTVTITQLTGVIPVESVSLNKVSTDISVNGTERLFATVNPGNATNKGVTWSSSAEAVATVASDGTVTGKAVGTAIITARSAADTTKFATCTVNVFVQTISVTGVTLNRATMPLNVGASGTLIATVSPDNASIDAVEWISSNSLVASVDSTGIVTGVSAGSAVITVRTVDGKKEATCTVTVSNVPVTGITLNQTTLSLVLGNSFKLVPTVAPTNATNKAVTWSSSNTARVTVDSDGNVTAVGTGSGTVTITARSVSNTGVTATCAVTVTTIAVTGVSLDRTTMSLVVGDKDKLVATVAPDTATNKAVTWSSNNTGRATVDSEGNVTAVGAGAVTITATSVSNTNRSATCAVTVIAATVPASGVTLSPGSVTIKAGNTTTLTPTVAPANASNKNVTWSSSNTAVATVANGVVTGVKGGSATITVTTVDGGFTATSVVTVEDNATVTFEWADAGVSLTPSPSTLTISQGGTVTITAPPGLSSYVWYVDSKIVSGVASNVFIFDSTGRPKGKYTISLWAGNSVGGDAIQIIVQ